MKKIFLGLLILAANLSLKSAPIFGGSAGRIFGTAKTQNDPRGDALKEIKQNNDQDASRQEFVNAKLKSAQDLYKKCVESTFAFRHGNAFNYFVAEQNKRADFCRMFVKLTLKEEFKNK